MPPLQPEQFTIIVFPIKNANQYFIGLGFQEDQIGALVETGERDLTQELDKLSKLLNEDQVNIEAINLSLHALKGLFLMMGNTQTANHLNELRQKSESQSRIVEIKKVLGI